MKVVGENALEKLIKLIKAKFESLAKVATSGSYNDLSGKPTIPSVGNGKITIKQGGIIKGAFTVNQSGATGIELDDNDTHYASGTVVTNDATKTGNYGAALTNGNVHLNHVENGAVKNSHKITGAGATTVTSDASGNIIITSTDNNTTYGAATTSANGLMTKEDKAKLDNLQVGGRNLLANTDVIYTRTKNDTYFESYIFRVVSDINLNDLIGKKTVYSFWLNSPGERTQHETSSDAIKNRFGSHGTIIWQDSTGANPNRTVYPFTSNLTLTEEKTRVYATYTITPPVGYDTIKDMRLSFQLYARPADTNDATWEIGQPKLEIGTIPTDWTPAPEDTTYSTGTENKAGLTKLYNGLGSNTDGTMTQLAIGDALNGKAGAAHTHDAATSSKSGFLSKDDKTKLDGIAAGAQVNQKAFSQFAVGTTEIKADTETDILTLVAGSNVTLTPDATNDRITIAAKDTTYTSLPNPNGLRVQVNGDGASEVRYDGSEAKTINLVAGDNVTLTQKTSENKVTIAAKDTTYSTGTDKTAGITKLYSGLGSNTDGTMTQLAIDDALAGKAGSAHTHTKSQITDFPTSLKNPNGLRVQVNGDGASEVRYDGSVAKTINIKAGSNITITSDSSGNITISSTASAGSVTGDVGTVVYEATAYNTGLRCDGSTTNNTNNSVTIQDGNWSYKRFRFYCKGYFGLVCTDMPLDRQCDSYITDNERGKRYGGVIFPTAENGNINDTGIGPSKHMYYEIKWRVEKVAVGWTVRVVDSGWLGFNAGITSNADYTSNAGTSNDGTGYISWHQRHNYSYGIYKIVAYTN